MGKPLKIILISFGILIVIVILGLAYIGANSPETYVYTSDEIPTKYIREINRLGLLEENENIEFFYSDGLLDIKGGIFILTDKHLILYVDEWNNPKTIIDFSEINYLDIQYDDSFLNDSFIIVESENGFSYEFPVSSELGRDKKFFEALQQKVENARA